MSTERCKLPAQVQLPKRLYKYMSLENGEKFAENLALRISPRSALNDPFELMPSYDFVMRHYLDMLKTHPSTKHEVITERDIKEVLREGNDYTRYVEFKDGKKFYEEMGGYFV